MTRTFKSGRTFIDGDVIQEREIEDAYLYADPVVPDDDELPSADTTTMVGEIKTVTDP